MQSQKCPQCNLVNFATSEVCKRCGSSLLEAKVTDKAISPLEQQNFQNDITEPNTLNLNPCPDCLHLCSQMAETCPNCGRFLRHINHLKNNVLLNVLPKVVAAGLVIILCVIAYSVFFKTKRDVEVKAAVISGEPAKAGVTNKNLESAKAALNAVGEIDSVTSVGTNYIQYTNIIQSAKIKYDVAMRDYKPQDAAEVQIQQQLEETFSCYIDAKDAWSEFISEGEALIKGSSRMTRLSSEYGFRATSEYGFYRSEVLTVIWEKASKKFNNLKDTIK